MLRSAYPLYLKNVYANTSFLRIAGILNVKGSKLTSSNRLLSVEAPTVNDGIVSKFFKKVGWLDHNQTRLKIAGYFLYECVPSSVNYDNWVEYCRMPDAFSTWFVITELHVWLLMVRCMAEDLAKGQESKYVKDGDGRILRNAIVEAMWADVGNRIKLIEGANPSLARKQVWILSEQFQATLMAYDEGFAGDKELAGAIWRRFYQMKDIDANQVLNVVEFIRKQIFELDKIPSAQLKSKPEIKWIEIDKKR